MTGEPSGRANMNVDEKLASVDLDISGFHFKWKKAKEMANSPRIYEDGRHLLPYWERARMYFFELGGEKVGQKYGERC